MIPRSSSLGLCLDLSPSESRRLRWRTATADPDDLTALGLPLWVACAWDQRPVGGLAGVCDQRLDGGLSRQLQSGRLGLERGEVALVGAAQRRAGAHLLLMGLGGSGPMESSQAVAMGRESAERVHKLGATEYALEPPWSDEVPGPVASRIASDFVGAHVRWRLAALGPGGRVTVILVVPQNVRVVAGGAGRAGQAGRAGRDRRSGLMSRRRHRVRRSVFLRRRRKK